MAIRKVCCAAGCDDLAIDGGPHCGDHAQEAAERSRRSKARGKTSDVAKVGAALYSSAWWKSEAPAFLARNPLCVDCLDLGVIEPATDVDHIIPHRGCRKLFRNRKNWQSLCKSCHSRKTAREVLHRG